MRPPLCLSHQPINDSNVNYLDRVYTPDAQAARGYTFCLWNNNTHGNSRNPQYLANTLRGGDEDDYQQTLR